MTAALEEAKAAGLSAVDAIHVAVAKALGCEDLYTTERPDKPIVRITGLKVFSLS